MRVESVANTCYKNNTLAADGPKQTISSSTSFNQQQTETVIENRQLLAHGPMVGRWRKRTQTFVLFLVVDEMDDGSC